MVVVLSSIFPAAHLETYQGTRALRAWDSQGYTHALEESKLVKIFSNVPRETGFTNKLRLSFVV